MVWYRLAATGRSGHFAPITWFSLHPEKKCGPAPGAIDVTLPELGQIVTFTRSLQVDGGAARELKLSVETIARGNLPLAVMAGAERGDNRGRGDATPLGNWDVTP